MDKYVIINKTTIQKRTEELEKEYDSTKNGWRRLVLLNEKRIYKQILAQSVPLIPEIEKSWEHGYTRGYNLACCEGINSECLTPNKQDCISNLKLVI